MSATEVGYIKNPDPIHCNLTPKGSPSKNIAIVKKVKEMIKLKIRG